MVRVDKSFGSIHCDGGQGQDDAVPVLGNETDDGTAGRRGGGGAVGGGGLGLVDFDDDGDLDLVVPNGATLDALSSDPLPRIITAAAPRIPGRSARRTNHI